MDLYLVIQIGLYVANFIHLLIIGNKEHLRPWVLCTYHWFDYTNSSSHPLVFGGSNLTQRRGLNGIYSDTDWFSENYGDGRVGSLQYNKNYYHRWFEDNKDFDSMLMVGYRMSLIGSDAGIFLCVWGTFYANTVLDRGSL